MSLYPKTYYISNNEYNRFIYRPVVISGYREAISIDAFRNNMLNTAYNFYAKKGRSKAYDYVYSVEWSKREIEERKVLTESE